MAVESRFVVIRQGVEVETFMDKKAADDYDKMLDMADNLSEMFEQAPVELSEEIREELSVYLAQNRECVLVALQAKKAKVQSSKAVSAKPIAKTLSDDSEAENPTPKESKTKVASAKLPTKKTVAKSKTEAA
ncbi:YebG family protein [Cognaticolwellia mytili]|uniref:YebG family protein n=1 Tax=Cognaticolwellia mytili TaxID=1888913 RepID=UPI000A16EB69|nr:YebG family protein [Cognaticolwellia mytili]